MMAVVVCSIKGCIDTFWRGLEWESNAKPIKAIVSKARTLKLGTTKKKIHQEMLEILEITGKEKWGE